MLAIRALLPTGQKEVARQRIDEFRRAYPDSVFGPMIDDAASKAASY